MFRTEANGKRERRKTIQDHSQEDISQTNGKNVYPTVPRMHEPMGRAGTNQARNFARFSLPKQGAGSIEENQE
jgi:hypothetical protein